MSAIYDPLSRADLPAPRHAIESDDEDFSDDADEEKDLQEQAPSSEVIFSTTSLDQFQGKNVVVLVDQVGEAVADQLELTEIASVSVAQKQIASLAQCDDAVVMLLSPGSSLRGDLSRLTLIIRSVLLQIKPARVHVVTHYNPSLYIDPHKQRKVGEEAPIRYLSSSTSSIPSSKVQPFKAPNYLSSNADAIVLQECTLLSVPATAILVPVTNPQAQSVTFHRQRPKKKSALQEEFSSDDEEVEEYDIADPSILAVLGNDYPLQDTIATINATKLGLTLRSSDESTGKWSSSFIRDRRKEATRRRRDVGGMYV
ncbi:unnamed protein product [Sympodiomycopsis kandeliae]